MVASKDEHPKQIGFHALGRTELIRKLNARLADGVDHGLAVVFMHVSNLNGFEHQRTIEIGDEIMRKVSDAIASSRDASGLVARYTTNSFIFASPVVTISPIIESVDAYLRSLETESLTIPRAGYVVCREGVNADGLIERARFAYDSVKFNFNVSCQCFDSQLETSFEKRSYVIDRLDDAIASGEIRVYAQPIVRLLTGQVCEVECLARWESPEYGSLSPVDFVPELERQQLIHKLDAEVIRKSCEQWSEAKKLGINVPFGINLSRLDFELCDIYPVVRGIMARYDVPVDQVHIEVTESALSHAQDLVWDGVQKFREAGFEIYLDDFGTGYSSLEALETLDIDVVKLDMSLLNGVEQNERARVVLADVISMVKRLGMQTLCEGVETEEQLSFLRAVGCEKAQGYLFGRPVPHEAVMDRLASDASRYESSADDAYLDAVGQVNLLDGTSAMIHGVEAANFLGSEPIGIVEVSNGGVKLLASNVAYDRFMNSMGFDDFYDFVNHTMLGDGRVHYHAVNALTQAKEMGRHKSFDFIVRGTFCSVEATHIASSKDRDAYINHVTAVRGYSGVTEGALLSGLLDVSNRMIYWKDSQHRYLGANQAFVDFIGLSELEDLMGKTDADLNWCEDILAYLSEEMDVLEGKSVKETMHICASANGRRVISSSMRPLLSGGVVVGMVGYFKDLGPAQ